ncbi:tripeptidyl-peptidase sed2 [Aspergillus tubingensis]|uniref:tripeptidyl-peptidase II n=2 Tax=Aspergillus subgen. Circumdati TaxID=2720871 RepID=A0A124BXM8_ASPNG|nr:tripeptidyl-peptidase [Aspergillus tubingensis]GAQ42907.1 tripeptidyl-peptidase [Aspergillus niger]GFN11008.1 tripeptidyl-peptidase [Aspergillus tubingensis]GLA58254.1 tripeptidyl-peptidase sed2 [Aspergillus tubingensis]GLA84363.1 tripeptidyl-peptidase sed2 [Aspergillus tubingensis]GLA98091.1 tripeptidyl-peptidase sed2 [Aspergillus tubingensis]
MLSSLLSQGAAVSLAVLSLLPSPVAAEIFEKLSGVPNGWRYANNPHGNEIIRLQIALQQHDVAGFEQAVMDMSTPGHADYGKHFRTHDEMKRMLLPSDTAVDSVRDWLESAGVHNIQVDADWVKFHTTVDKANALLDADFKWYVSDAKHIRRLRTLQYSIPDALVSHINMIQPTTRFGQIQPNRATMRSKPKHADETFLTAATLAQNTSHCDSIITPHCLKQLYNIGDYQADPKSGSKVGFASYLEEYARYADLERFEQHLAPNAIGQNFSVVQFNGGLNDQLSLSDSGEANLDLQYILGVSSPVPITEYSTGGRGELVPDLSSPDPNDNSNEPYLDFLQGILKLNNSDLPQVISTSYGEDEQTIPVPYARTVCNLYAQLGSRGVSVIFSSGDSGVGAACLTNDGTNRTHFPPQFPASCPWVTSVGATSKTSPEQAVSFSSGGFSDLWPRPSYQQAAVQTYLTQHLGNKFSGLFNASGRAFPDVAAQGENYAVYDKGMLGQFDGTSCSAPTFSGVIALLNDARLRAGLPVMGFLNPFLYGVGSESGALNDIVKGGSVGCDGRNRFGGTPNGSPVVPFASWNATTGWDPVSGLGTPDFAKLKGVALGEAKAYGN